jgi:hypothetical protein
MREDEYYQMQLERQQMLEEALERAKQGEASEDDWSVIHFECGVSRPILQTVGIK